MAYTALTSAEVQVNKPVNSSMMTKVKDNFDYLYSNAAGGGGLVNNGNFEIDMDADDLPDNWTVSLFTGGAASMTTVTSYVANGHYAIQFTHPGGAGNGGGQGKSDYIECSSAEAMVISFSSSSTATKSNFAISPSFNAIFSPINIEP